MIGASHSPLSMFTAGTGDAFQRGMAIGDANSPFSPIARALKGTLDKYNQSLMQQQEHNFALDRMRQEVDYKRKGAGSYADPDFNKPHVTVDETTGKYFYGNTNIDPETGVQSRSWSPLASDSLDYKNELFKKFLEDMRGGAGIDEVIPPAPVPSTPQANAAQGRMIDKATAAQLLQQAGGDPAKARMLAKQAGFTF